MELIKPAEVQRDTEGYWSHPGIPEFEEGEEDKFKAWVDSQGLVLSVDHLEDENEDHPAVVKYFEEGSADISDWHPDRPAGDGWFVLSIHMTEDGAAWVWARSAVA